jgi:hypothetical protein
MFTPAKAFFLWYYKVEYIYFIDISDIPIWVVETKDIISMLPIDSS